MIDRALAIRDRKDWQFLRNVIQGQRMEITVSLVGLHIM